MEPKTYAEAGVDIQKAEAFVARLKHSARRDGHRRLWRGAGGYASVYPTSDGHAVALTTDGVGTKLLLALELNKFDTIGIDLVAMCANDLLCVGANPVAFLDYYATGKLDENVSDALLAGIIKGCDQAGMLLVGGETAELPDLYDKGHFDLAGFAMGTVSKESLITGEHIKPGDKLIGVASSGIHSNGLSLARKLIGSESPLRKELLVPTQIYCKPFVRLLERFPGAIKGVAHITGGGWTNIPRPNDQVGYLLENHMPVPAVMQEMAQQVSPAEMYKTFNMGMGLCIMVQEKDVENVLSLITSCDLPAMVVGEVVKKPGLTIKGGLGEEQISL
jgi:phosphoribosylaminoimidazole synthetase